jgi:Uncharacterized protein conserved in bacteria (DUF2325)
VHPFLADCADHREHRYILAEITLQPGWHNMGHPISLDHAVTGSTVSLFESAGAAAPASIFPKQSVLPQLAERELPVRVQQILAPASRGRSKIWEFDASLDCAIVGTCLSTAELRHVLIKLGLKEAATATEHDLHASGGLLAGKHHEGAKLLHKALDRRHRAAVNQFARGKSTDEISALRLEAVRRGEIPGGYWAALTHPATNDALVREVLSEVHMLSHLVGAANRADIRLLRQLEAERTEFDAKVARQQQQLRDATIRELRRALEERLPRDGKSGAERPADSNVEVWQTLAGDLKRRLATAETHRERSEGQLTETRSSLAAARSARGEAEQREQELRHELEAIEASLAAADEPGIATPGNSRRLDLTLLYVGGRQAQIGHLRAIAERSGAVFLHHDGGVEERGGLLPGFVSRADAVVFPVDCVSHVAMSLVKRLCRQTSKPFVPMRSAGLVPFCSALHHLRQDQYRAAAD